ncbi:MAG: hypothetical protein AAFP77_25150 [Bacteroidota bacterium]
MKRKHLLWPLSLLVAYLLIVLPYRPIIFKEGRGVQNPLAHYQFSEKYFDEAEIRAALPQLKNLYGSNKRVSPAYELHFYTALSFYPNLRNAHIHFHSRDLPTSMRAKPANSSLLTHQRQYCIFINDQSTEVVDLSRATFTELTGCIIHELAHIQDYESRSNGGIIWTGLQYLLSQTFKSKLEKKTDRIAAQHGGGYYLYLFTDFVFERAAAAEDYLENKKQNYYTPDQLLQLHQETSQRDGLN